MASIENIFQLAPRVKLRFTDTCQVITDTFYGPLRAPMHGLFLYLLRCPCSDKYKNTKNKTKITTGLLFKAKKHKLSVCLLLGAAKTLLWRFC